MRSLSHEELSEAVKARLRWCSGWRHPDLWPTLSGAQQKLVEYTHAEALGYHDALMHARRVRDERRRWGPE